MQRLCPVYELNSFVDWTKHAHSLAVVVICSLNRKYIAHLLTTLHKQYFVNAAIICFFCT